MSQVKVDLDELIGVIGPRGACTEGERRAASYIKGRFDERGLSTTVQEFRTITTYSYLYLFYVLVAIACGVLNLWYPYVVAPIAVVNAFLFTLDLEMYPSLGRLFPKGKSQNVIGEVPAEGGRVNVMVVAHYDSARASLSFDPRLVKNFRLSFNLMIGSIVAVAALSLTNLLLVATGGFSNHGVWYASLAISAYLLLPVVQLLHREIAMDYTPGANDNGSGVVTMLGLMDKVAEEEPGLKGIMFAATGAEEVGTSGMLALLREQGERLKGSLIINLDNLGTGNLKIIDEEGMLLPHPSSPELLREAEEVIRDKSFPISRASYRLLSTDATPALARGYSAMSIMAFDEKGALPNWHWESDVLENLDMGNLEVARGFLWNLLKRLDPR